MKVIHILVIAALLMTAQSSFANKICLQDGNGFFWELKGGKVDKKTYTARQIIPGVCEIGGYADVTVNSHGVYSIAIYNGHDPTGNCAAVPTMYSLIGDEFFNSSGTYDGNADGTIDGNITFTNVSCSALL